MVGRQLWSSGIPDCVTASTGLEHFAHPPRGSRYFIIGSVTLETCAAGNELLDLRRDLAWEGFSQPGFHATSDKQTVREQVYALLEASEFRADVTILEKPKTQDHLRADPIAFYKQAWFFHFQDLAPEVIKEHDELLVVASALQVNRKKQAIHTFTTWPANFRRRSTFALPAGRRPPTHAFRWSTCRMGCAAEV